MNTAVCKYTYSITTHGVVYVDNLDIIIIISLSCIPKGYEPNYDSNYNNKNTDQLTKLQHFHRIGDQ